MAFVTSGTASLASSLGSFRPVQLPRDKKTTPNRPVRHSTPQATAVQPNRTRQTNPPSATPIQRTPSSKARPRTSAHVIDSRISSRHEVHHWVVVKDHSRRMFERAAVAQADVAHKLEHSRGAGALHRWVLRESADESVALSTGQGNSRYLVVESFDRSVWNAASAKNDSLSRRWLSAVERVGPVISTVDIRSLQYRDVFTSKVHDVVFNPNSNVVVLELFNADLNVERSLDCVLDALRAKAERSVASGNCLEFCVLQSTTERSLFKTVEVYADDASLRRQMDGLDKKFMHSVRPHVANGLRNRHVFKPVVFA